MIQIRQLMVAWGEVTMLTTEQKELVIALRDFAAGNEFEVFQIFATSLMHQYHNLLVDAIFKARAEGLGAKVS